MGEVSIIGVDLAKNVFQVHGSCLLTFSNRTCQASCFGPGTVGARRFQAAQARAPMEEFGRPRRGLSSLFRRSGRALGFSPRSLRERRMLAFRSGRIEVVCAVEGPHAWERSRPRPASRLDASGWRDVARRSSTACLCGRRVAEGRVGAPHGVQDHRQLARQCDHGLSRPGALGDREGSVAQAGCAELARHDGVGGLVEMGPGHPIAALRDAAVAADLAGLVAPRHQPEVGAGARRAAEPSDIVEGSGNGERGLVREMLAFAAERIMDAEVEAMTGAAKGARTVLREKALLHHLA